MGPGLTIPFAESRLPHFVCRPSLVPVVVCRPRLLPAAAPITWPRPDLPLGSALNSPPTATRGNHPPRPLHQPPPTILLAPLLPSQRRGPPRPVVECRRPSRAVPPAVAVCCRRRCRPPLPTPPTAAVSVAVAAVVAIAPAQPPLSDYRHRHRPRRRRRRRRCRCRRRPRTRPQCFRCSRPRPNPIVSPDTAPSLSLHDIAPSMLPSKPPPLVAPNPASFSVAVRRDVDPPSCRAQTTPRTAAPGTTAAVPRPCRATSDPPPRRLVRQTSTLAAGLTRRSPPPLRSPDVVHRSRRLPPRSSLSSQLSPSPVAAAEIVHATPRR